MSAGEKDLTHHDVKKAAENKTMYMCEAKTYIYICIYVYMIDDEEGEY